MTSQLQDLPAGSGVPNAGGSVVRCSDDKSAIGRKRGRSHAVGVTGNRQSQRVGRQTCYHSAVEQPASPARINGDLREEINHDERAMASIGLLFAGATRDSQKP